MYLGFIANTLAIFTLCFWPKDRLYVFFCSWSLKFTFLSASFILSVLFSILKFFKANSISSNTFGKSIWASGFWKTIPTSFLNSFLLKISTSSIKIFPAEGFIIPEISFKSVYLPHPFLPIILMISPSFICKFISLCI